MYPTEGTSTLTAADRVRIDPPIPAAAGLILVGEMYGMQLDQLAVRLAVTPSRANAITARWRVSGLARCERLGPGPRWVWLTRAGLSACGLPYAAAPPGLARLAHLRAVTAARLSLEAAPAYREGGAHWRSERLLRMRIGGRLGGRQHVPDGEVHWPDTTAIPWAGECWAIEVELTPKTVARTVAIMRELLTRTGDYGCAASQVRVPGQPARHRRIIYVCAPAALPVVARARNLLPGQATRIELRSLPPAAILRAADGELTRRSAARASAPGPPGGQ